MAVTDQTRGLALDLLAWQTQGRVRSSLLSARCVVTPEFGTTSNFNKTLAISEVFAVPISGVIYALAIRCSGNVDIAVTLERTPSADDVFTTKCTGMLVITDSISAVSITNPSPSVPVDVSIVSI